MSELRVSDHLQRTYDKHYEAGSTEWRRLGALDKTNDIVALCAGVPHASILDIGAGDGAILQRLDDIGFGDELYGLEIAGPAVDLIRRRALKRLAACTLYDGYTIPYPDKRFDLAVLSHVVEHLEHPRRLILEAKRVARHVFVEVPTEDNLTLVRDFRDDGVGHINFYSPATIRLLLQTCGLEVLDQRLFNASRAIYEQIDRNRNKRFKDGPLRYYVKEALLRSVPRLATRLLTFHCALLCRPAGS